MFKKFLFPVLCAMIIMSCTKPCDNTLCMNDGVCVDGTCLCPEGFYGDNCEFEVVDESNDVNQPSYRCNSENINYDGYSYDLVEVDGRCWFAENLRTTTFNNGDPLIEETNILNWTIDNQELNYINTWAYTPIEGVNGLLYSGNIIIDERNVCPVGWHVSTDIEWLEVESLIGVSPNELNVFGPGRGFDKRQIIVSEEIYGIDSLGLNLNSTGGIGNCSIAEFYDGSYVEYHGEALHSNYWTSTIWQDNSKLISRNLSDVINNNIRRDRVGVANGMAIRCVKD